MPTNKDLYQSAKKAIDDLFSDTTVSQAQCCKNLKSLMSEIEIMLSGLNEDGDAEDYDDEE